jgi:hypothetical protein
VGDPNIQGDATLKVISEGAEYDVASSGTSVTMFAGATRAVKLDVNGNTLRITNSLRSGNYTNLTVNSSDFEIFDSKSTGSATDDNGKEKLDAASLTGGALQLAGTSLILNNANKLAVKNIRIEASGGTSRRQVINATATPFEIDNAIIDCESGTGATYALLQFTGAGSVFGSVVKNETGLGITAGSSGTSVFLSNNTVEAGRDAVNVAANGTVTIDGGFYGSSSTSASYGAVKCGNSSTVLLKSGVFNGNLRISTEGGGEIIIRNVYHKGEFSFYKAGIGYIAAEHCRAEAGTGEYEGYTHYIPRTQHASAVSVKDPSGQVFAAATVAASVNGAAQANLADVWDDEEIVYSLTVMPNYRISKIAYTPSGESEILFDLTNNPNYKLSDDGLTATYTMTVPDKDYALSFQLTEQADGTDVVQIGDVKYNSLSAALAYLQDNQTLKLLKDITYATVLEFGKANTILDLNGKTLTMNVPTSNTPSDDLSILLSAGALTVKDGSGAQNGAISFGNGAGIRVTGTGAVFTLESGTIKDLSSSSNHYSISCTGANATVNITGGLLVGRIFMNATGSNLNISGGRLKASHSNTVIRVFMYGGEVNITGGQIYSGPDALNTDSGLGIISVSNSAAGAGVSTDTVVLNIGGDASVIGENPLPAIEIGTGSARGKVQICDNAQVINTVGATLKLNGASSKTGAVNSSVEIKNNAKLKGATYAVEFVEFDYAKKDDGTTPMTYVNINGGYFACGEEYIPISDTYYATFSENKVLNTTAEGVGNYEGFHTLTTKDSLKGSYHFNDNDYPYTYQDYEGISDGSNRGLKHLIDEDATPLYTGGNSTVAETGQPKYPTESWSAFTNAYDLAKRVMETNRNANQSEIDFRSGKLLSSMRALESVKGINPKILADGTYSLDLQMEKLNGSALSMSNNAFKKPAILTIKDGKARLSVNLGPTYQYFLYGHLEDFYLWKGNGFSDTMANANMVSVDVAVLNKAAYSNFYAGSYDASTVDYRKDADGTDAYSTDYPYPGTVSFDLPYRGIEEDESKYLCYVVVDAMDRGAAAIMRLKWGSLTPINVNATLSLDTDTVSLLTGGTQTVNATLLSADGYTVTWESDNTNVATVNGGVITAVGAGGCTVTAKAAGPGTGDIVLTKTIAVTVADSGKTAVKIDGAQVAGSVATAALSGDVLVTNGAGNGVTTGNDTVTIDAKSNDANVTTAKVQIPSSVIKAVAANESVTFKTDVGDVAFSKAALTQLAQTADDTLTLTIAEAALPPAKLGSYAAAYELSLTNGAGASVSFANGDATVTVPCADANVRYVYIIEDGARVESMNVTQMNGVAIWKTPHFSLWALSAEGYALGGGDEGVADGTYSLANKTRLWNYTLNQASMGDPSIDHSRSFAVISENGTKAEIHLFFRAMTFSGMTGHLLEISNITDPVIVNGILDDWTPVPARIESWLAETDEFLPTGKKYPEEVVIFATPGVEYTPVFVNVPVMGDAANQPARVWVDWSDIAPYIPATPPVSEAPVTKTPDASVSVSVTPSVTETAGVKTAESTVAQEQVANAVTSVISQAQTAASTKPAGEVAVAEVKIAATAAGSGVTETIVNVPIAAIAAIVTESNKTENASVEVVLTIESALASGVASVTLDAATLAQAVTAAGTADTVSVTLTQDATAMLSLAQQAPDVIPVGKVPIAVTISAGNEQITDLASEIAITVPYVKTSGSDKKVVVWYVAANGAKTKYDAAYENGRLTFTTDKI